MSLNTIEVGRDDEAVDILRNAARRGLSRARRDEDNTGLGLCHCLLEVWAHPEMLPDLVEDTKDLLEFIRDMPDGSDLARLKTLADNLTCRFIRLSLS